MDVLQAERGEPALRAWPREAVFIARDFLLIGAVLFYVIGFTYQTAKLQRFFGASGASMDARSQIALATWAFEALRNGAPWYAAIASFALCFVAAAVCVNRVRAARPFRMTLVYALVAAGVSVAVFGSSWLAWQMGSGT